MKPVLPAEAVEFGAAADRAFADLGGVDAARRAEEVPDHRSGDVAKALTALGVDELDPRDDEDSLAAAATLCASAGRVALPYPVASVLLRTAEDDAPFAVVCRDRPRVDHGDLFERWRVAPLDGPTSSAAPAGARLGTRLGPFVTDVATDGAADSDAPDGDRLLWLALTAWQVLGTCERAVDLAVEHVSTRIQFGKPLSAFQAVQFQLADAHVAVAGLRELACFTLWRLRAAPDGALPDVLALRLHSLDVARPVLRVTQQLHGAAGVCDEYDVSVLTRHVQPALRIPASAEATAAALADAIGTLGFEGLFPHDRAAG